MSALGRVDTPEFRTLHRARVQDNCPASDAACRRLPRRHRRSLRSVAYSMLTAVPALAAIPLQPRHTSLLWPPAVAHTRHRYRYRYRRRRSGTPVAFRERTKAGQPRREHPVYRTSSNVYGSKVTVETLQPPAVIRPTKFSEYCARGHMRSKNMSMKYVVHNAASARCSV